MERAIPPTTHDRTDSQHFSRPFEESDVAWLKSRLHVRDARSATGADDFSYRDILRIPNDKLVLLYNQYPESYRIIGLECTLLKGLTLLVERRLRLWAEEEGVVPPSQNGFRPGYNTHNNAFIFREAVERCRADGKTLYVAIVDLTNAFPSTHQPTLWTKLYTMGASGPIVD
ncbi:hypothetical protein PUNSTDRAFT_78243, partial [Punctularia strigosozonata HHB-11173 SS5]